MSDPRTITLENALKALGINPDNDPVYHAKRWVDGRDSDRRERDQANTARDNAAARVTAREMRIADLERDLAAKDASLKTAHAALKRICEVIGAPVPACPADAVEAVKAQLGADSDAENRAKAAEATIAEIGLALDDYSAPTHYNTKGSPHDNGAEIPAAERARVGLMVLWSKWSEAFNEARESSAKADRLTDEHYHANKTLDALGAPRQAGGADLDLSARIRAIPR